MKKILICLICLFSLFAFNKVNKVNASKVFNVEYEVKGDFRAVWVSHLVSDVSQFTSVSSMQSQMTTVLNNMEKYNLNVLMFHIRIYNDALYNSEFNKKSSYYKIPDNYDALPWIIDEAHKRGIEFHAWMNPYRVSTSSSNVNTIASGFPSNNPASNPANLLKGSSVTILNPGLPVVQDFLVQTVMEVVNNYNIDAIHFDDYFYTAGINDQQTFETYGAGRTIENFRRESVDTLIRRLSNSISYYNELNNKAVQLGISPTPVWYTGNGEVTYDAKGNAITNGSDTPPAELHYGGPLFCDTLKWINEEWIDYIVPQCYVGFSDGSNLFNKATDWWSKVVEYKKTKLYIGIGIYRANGQADWSSRTELKDEFDYMATVKNVEGYAFFSYKQVISATPAYRENMENASEYFSKKTIVPLHPKTILDKPDKVRNAFVIKTATENQIYVSHDESIRYTLVLKEVDGVVSLFDIGRKLYFTDEASDATYYVCNVGYDNQLSDYTVISTNTDYDVYEFLDPAGEILFKRGFKDNEEVILDDPIPPYGMQFDGWDLVSGNTYKAKFSDIKLKISYVLGGRVYQEVFVSYGESAPNIEVTHGYYLKEWKNLPESVTSDCTVTGVIDGYREYNVYYYNGDELIQTDTFEYLDPVNITKKLSSNDKQFLGWLLDGELVTKIEELEDDVYLYASFLTITYIISYDLDGGVCSDLQLTFEKNQTVELKTPEKEGYKFVGWYENDKVVKTITNKNYQLVARWLKIHTITLDVDGEIEVIEFVNVSEIDIEAPSKDGYIFKGWYEDDQKVTDFELRDYQLVAVFEAVPSSGCNALFTLYNLLTLFAVIFVLRRIKK